jgi:hypothetical protein
VDNECLSITSREKSISLIQFIAGKENYNAVDEFSHCFGCRWVDPMGDQQLHPDAVHYKVNSQCRGGYRGDPLVIECLRGHRSPPGVSHREVKRLKFFNKQKEGTK